MTSPVASRLASASFTPVRRRQVAALLAALAALPALGQTTITYLTGQANYTGALTPSAANPFTLFINSGTATQSGVISGTGGPIKKTGAGTLTLSANNTYTGSTTVDAGTLILTGFTYSQGASAGSLIVNNGGTLALNRSDILGVFTANSPATITINAGGLVTNNGVASFNTLNNLALNGGTLQAAAGVSATSPAYQLKGTVTTGGSTASLITTTGAANSGIQLGNNSVNGTTTFNVADATASGLADLTISAVLQDGRNSVGTFVASGLIKNGAGNLVLSGANTYTGTVTLNAGTLGIGHNQALGNGTNVLVINGGTIRADGAARVVANPLLLNGNFTVGRLTTFTGATTLGADITITGNNYDGPANADSTFNGVIGGSGRSVTIAQGPQGLGTGAIIFGGANTYTGSTTVQSGRLVLANTTASTAYVIDSGAVLELSVGTGVDRDLPTATFSGAGTLLKTGAGSVLWGGGAATFALASGALIDVQAGLFRGGSNANEDWSANLSDLNVAAGASFNGVEANVRVDALTGSGTITSGYDPSFGYLNFTFGVDGGSGTFAGVLANSPGEIAHYVKAGSGTQTLSGANTYTGTTTLAGGTLALGSAGALGATSSIAFNGGTLQFSATNTTDYSAFFSTVAGQLYRLDTAGQSVALATALTSTGGSLVKLGDGTLTLSGANTFTGGITVSDGTLRATTNASALGAGSLVLAGGDLALANDTGLGFNRPVTVSADALVTIDRLTSGTTTTLIHTLGNLSIGSQTLSSARGTNITSGIGAVSFGNVTLTGAAVFSPGLNSQINLATITQTGGTHGLTLDGPGTLNTQAPVSTYSGVTTVHGGGLLLVTNAFGNGGAGSPIGVSSSDAANLVIDGGTIRLTNPTNTSSDRLFTLGTNGATLDGSGGGLFLLTNPGPIALTGANANRTLTLTGSSSAANILAPSLGDNGTGVTSLTKTGATYWILSGANSYTGATTVTGGTLALSGAATLSSTNLALSGGSIIALSGAVTPAVGTGPGQVQFGTGGGGFAAYGAPLAVTTFASTPIWGAGGALTDGTSLSLGSAIATHAVTVPSAIDLGAGLIRTISVNDNTATPDDLAILSGVISSGVNGQFTKAGVGTLVLTAANTYTGQTTVTGGGTLALAGAGTVSGANLYLNNGVFATNDTLGFSRPLGNGAGQVQLGGSGGGFAAYGGPLTISSFTGTPVWGATPGFSVGGSTLIFGSINATDRVTWTNDFSLGSASRTIQVNDNLHSLADSAEFSGIISGAAGSGLSKTGAGLLTLSGASTYTGPTTLSGGILAVTSLPSVGAGPGSLGAPSTAADGTIAFNNSTLRYTGAGQTTNRVLNLGSVTSSGTVEASGTGPLVFTSALAATGTGAKNFTLGGTSTAANAFQGAIVNGSGTTNLIKSGPGSWSVSGANTYTGITIVNDGTLRLGSSAALANSALTVQTSTPGGASVLDLNGFNATVTQLTLGGTSGIVSAIGTSNASPTSSAHIRATGGGMLTLGTGGNITFNSSGNPLGSEISAGLLLAGGGARTFTANDSTTAAIDLAITGAIGETGSASVIKAGNGALLLSGANTYSGGTTLNAGTLIAGSDSALGTGAFTFAAGILQGDGTPRTLANPVNLTGITPIFGGAGDLTLTGLLTNATNNSPTFTFSNTGSTTLGPISLSNSTTNRTATFNTLAGLVTLGGVIANGGGSTAGVLSKSGSGTLVLAAANTYGGATFVSDGTLRLGADDALPATTAFTLVAPLAASPVLLDLRGHATSVASLTLASGTLASSQVVDSSGGGLLRLGGNVTYNNQATNPVGSEISASLDLGSAASRTFTVNDSPFAAIDLTVSGVIGDTTASGLVKAGSGTLALTAANTYRGATSLTAGTVLVGSLPSVGAGAGPLGSPATVADGTIALNGGTLRYTGAGQTTDRVINLSGTTTGGALDASGTGALVFTSAFTATGAGSKNLVLTGTSTAANTIQGAIVNNSVANFTSLTKAGPGTWLLAGANTYTGNTNVNDGTLALGSAGALTASTLVITASLPGATATFDLNGFNASTPNLILGGTGGASATSYSRVLATGGGTLSLGVSGITYSNTANPLGALVEARLDLGAASRTFAVNDSTTAAIDLTVSGDISASAANVGLTKTGLGTLLLSGANTYTGATSIQQGTLLLGSAAALPANALSIASNTANTTATLDLNGRDLTVASLGFGGGGNSTSVSNLSATGGGVLTLAGDVSFGSNGNNLGSTLAAAVNLGSGATRIFNIADSSGTDAELTVSGSIGQVSSSGILKTNTGTLLLTAANTYTGQTTVSGGTLALAGAGSLANSNLVLDGGVLALGGSSTPALGSGPGQVQFGAGGGGFAAFGAPLTVSTFDTAPVWGPGGALADGVSLILGSTSASHAVTLPAAIDLGTGSSQNITVNDNTATAADLAIVSGVISGAGSILAKAGAGTLVLTAANTYTGATAVNGGTLALSGAGTISAANLALGSAGVFATSGTFARPVGNGAGEFSLNGLSGGGFAAFGGPLTVTGLTGTWGTTAGFLIAGGPLVLGSVNATDAVTLAGNFSLGGAARTITVNDNAFSAADLAVISGVISSGANGALVKNGLGTLVLSGANTYTGATTLSGGVLSINSLPSVNAGPGSLGAPTTVVEGTINLNAATLRYTGSGHTSDRVINLASSSTLEASGTGPLVLTSALTAGSGAKNFILGGTSAAANAFQGAIVNGSGTTSLVKTGPGSWIVSGANTYSGSTTINNGPLRLGSSASLPNTALTIASNAAGGTAILDLGGYNATVPSLALGDAAGASATSSSHLVATGGGVLTLGGNVAFTSVNNPLGSTISAGLNLGSGATRTFTVADSTNAAIDLAVYGVIAETTTASILAKTGPGTLLLSGANTYTGGTTLSQGTLIAGSGTAFGTGPVSISGGVLQGDGTPRTLANAINLTGGTMTIGGTSDLALTGTLTNALSNNSLTLTISNLGSTTLGPVNLGTGATGRSLTFNTTGGLVTLAGPVSNGVGSGANSLVKSGPGTLELGAANTYTGTTTITDGTLRLGAAGVLPTGGLFVTAGAPGATAVFDLNGRDLTSPGFTLGGTNGATGTSAGHFIATGGGTVTLTGNINYQATGNPLGSVVSADVNLGAGTRSFSVADSTNAAIDLTVSGDISETAVNSGLTKIGAGTLLLSGTNTYTGTTLINSGTVLLGSATALAVTPVSLFANTGGLSATLDLGGFDASTTGLSFGGGSNNSTLLIATGGGTLSLVGNATVTFNNSNQPLGALLSADLNLGTATRTFSIGDSTNAANELTVSGVISASVSSAGLTKNGLGALLLSGANTYGGPTTVNDGTLRLGSATALPSASALTIASNAINGLAILDLNGWHATVASLTLGGVNLNGLNNSASRLVATGGGSLAFPGTLTSSPLGNPLGALVSADLRLSSGSTQIFQVGDSLAAVADLTISGAIGETTPASGFTKTGAGTLVLSGANTYSGPTVIQEGTVRLGAAGSLSAASALGLANSVFARLDLAGYDQTVGGLSGGGAFGGNISLGSAALTVQGGGAYSGLLSGTGRLVKDGSAGTLALDRANTYSGGTTLRAGTLALGHNAALGSGALTVTGGTLAPLGASRTLANSLVLDGDLAIASTAADHAFTFTGPATLSRDVTVAASQASGTLNVVHTFAGNIDGAHSLTLTRTGAAALGSTGGFVLSGVNTHTGGTVIDATRLFVSSDAILGASGGGLTLRNAGILAPTASLTSDRILTVGAGGGLLEQGVFNVSLGGLTGSAPLAKTGSGSLTLTGSSTYNGTLTSDSALVLGADAAFRFGPQGTTNAAILNNGTLILNSTSARTFNSSISGSGSLAIEGDTNGVLTLSGINAYTGGTTISGSRLFVATDANLGDAAGGLTLRDGGILHPTASLVSSRVLNLDTGGGTLEHGALNVTLSGLTGSGPLLKSGAGTLTLTGTTSYTGSLGGSGPLAKNGAGSLALGGDNSGFSGTVALNDGAVSLGHNSALGTGAVTLNGSSLQASGGARTVGNAFRLNEDTLFTGSQPLTLAGSFTLLRNRDLTVDNTAVTTLSGSIGQSGGGRGLNKYGAGELQLTGANTYSGGTYIGEGTVRINNLAGSAFGTGAVTVEVGATLAGAGTFTGALQLNGTFAPGNSPGLTTIGNGSVFNGATLIEIGGLVRGDESTGYDAIDVGLNGTGNILLGGTLDVVFWGSWTPTGSASFQIIKAASFGGSFAQVNLPAAIGYEWNTDRLNTLGILDLHAIPEPATWASLAGFASLAFCTLRRRRKIAP